MTDPQTDMKRLERLRDNVLEPFLKPKGYTTELPDDPSDIPDIMASVMRRIDTADILVADLTGNNPNVYYELGARHSLGLPYVLVSEETPRFDLAHLSCSKYPKGRPDERQARERIEEQLKKADAAARASRFVTNPISGFYGRPLAEVSPASGLALGYFRNFLRYALDDIRKAADKVEIQKTLAYGDRGKDSDKGWRRLTKQERLEAGLEVWVPKTLAEAFHPAIDARYLDHGLLNRARIVKYPRTFPLYARPRENAGDPLIFVDIPTALNAMQVAVDGRVPPGFDRDSDEWKGLERQEISRFRTAIKRQMSDPEFKVAMEDVSFPRSFVPRG